jgi:hypothetical protein
MTLLGILRRKRPIDGSLRARADWKQAIGLDCSLEPDVGSQSMGQSTPEGVRVYGAGGNNESAAGLGVECSPCACESPDTDSGQRHVGSVRWATDNEEGCLIPFKASRTGDKGLSDAQEASGGPRIPAEGLEGRAEAYVKPAGDMREKGMEDSCQQISFRERTLDGMAHRDGYSWGEERGAARSVLVKRRGKDGKTEYQLVMFRSRRQG